MVSLPPKQRTEKEDKRMGCTRKRQGPTTKHIGQTPREPATHGERVGDCFSRNLNSLRSTCIETLKKLKCSDRAAHRRSKTPGGKDVLPEGTSHDEQEGRAKEQQEISARNVPFCTLEHPEKIVGDLLCDGWIGGFTLCHLKNESSAPRALALGE